MQLTPLTRSPDQPVSGDRRPGGRQRARVPGHAAGRDLFSSTTPSGGDMGAHVLVPAYLRDNLLPSLRISGWSNDWFAGFPILYFYFPLPALTIVALDLVLPYGVAFKLVTIMGLIAMPAGSYYLARQVGAPRLVATMAGVAGGTFVFMESYAIYGGNIKSTLAGEYSFSWAMAFSLFYLGALLRDSRAGRRFSPLAAIMLAGMALSHIIPTAIVGGASLIYLLRPERRQRHHHLGARVRPGRLLGGPAGGHHRVHHRHELLAAARVRRRHRRSAAHRAVAAAARSPPSGWCGRCGSAIRCRSSC